MSVIAPASYPGSRPRASDEATAQRVTSLPLFADDRGEYETHLTDAFAWLRDREANSVHAVVTDPPYGLIEYSSEQLEKRKNGNGGVWRIPTTFDGCQRSPLPRFTVLTDENRASLRAFFADLARQLIRVLTPGAHVFIATNPLVSHLVYDPLIAGGLEPRGEIVRLVQTLRGGDRPKNAEDEFAGVTVLPRSCWEPWGLFRKPCDGKVSDTLRRWGTGGLRRVSAEEPFKDVIRSGVARGREREIAPHTSLKPQQFMRQLTRAALPLSEGTILDPFMGSGSTVAAASACGLRSIGLEINPEYYAIATRAIPLLAQLEIQTPCRRTAPRLDDSDSP